MRLTHEYRSAAKSKSCGKRKKKPKNPPSLLAQQTFAAFEPFINVFDPGICLEEPFHTITKEAWELNKRHKAGEKSLYDRNGKQFSPYHDIIRNIYSAEHVQKHLLNKGLSYYTSGKNGLGLMYVDLDVHHAWQTDEARAKELLQKLFPQEYWRASRRGYNGYLKVRYSRIDQFNDAADRLQATLKRLFLHVGILCDIEVKGTITTKEKSGRLAKLPFSTKPKYMKRDDTDCWNFQQLEKFKTCPVVNFAWVERLAEEIEPKIDEDRVAAFQEHKSQLAKQSDDERDDGLTLVVRPERPSPISVPTKSSIQPASPGKPKESPTTTGQSSGDAFERNRRDLLPFVRQFFRKNKTLPSVEDALTYLHENGLFSGCWHDGVRKRAVRVGQILDFIGQTFDPSLFKSNLHKQVSLPLGKFAWWVGRHFGSEMTANVADLRRFDPVSMTAPVQQVSVPASFIEKLLVVVDFCLRQDPLENKAVPTNRIKKIWAMVEGGSAWNQRFYQVVRDRLNKMGVVQIFDRQHGKGKAWRWKVGSNFPELSWKHQERKLKKLAKRLRTGVSYEEFVANTKIVRDDETHNSLYQTDACFGDLKHANQDIRPPPD